jgi:hypothetical protein
MSLTVDDIETVSGRSINKRTEDIINILINSANDWPNEVLKIDEYIAEIEAFIHEPATKVSLEDALLKMDLLNNSWKAESITQVLEIYHFYDENLSLREIINAFEVEVRKMRFLK